MKLSKYKRQLSKLLNLVSSEYENLIFSDKLLFEKCAVNYFTVVEPILPSDVDMLNKLACRVHLYI